MSGAAAIYLGSKSFFRSFEENLTRRVKLKRSSFIAQFKIDFLLLFTSCRKVLRKMSSLGVSRQIIVSQCFSRDMIDDMRDLYAENYFVVVVVVAVAVVVISFFWYYLHELSPENFAIYITNLKLLLKSRFKNLKISHAIINRKLIKQYQ